MRNFSLTCLFIFCVALFMGCKKNTNTPAAAKFVCPVNRFSTEIFTPYNYTMQYGTAIDYLGKNQNLYADISEPAKDTLALRPLIIYCHGGGFTGGARNSAWAAKFCQSFAKRGYVAASIDYRLGIGASIDDVGVLSAQIRAIQDAKTAIRFFKVSAIEQGNPYRIDTAQIYIAGESTGGIIALQAAYLKTPSQLAEVTDISFLGTLNGLEGNTNSSTYSSRVTGVISLSGAILDLNWIKNTAVPVIMVHGSKDASIPYKNGISNPYLYTAINGSYLIDSAAMSQKISSSLYTFKGAGATPFITSTIYADSTIKFVSQSLYSLIDCQRLGGK